ncbi:LamG-like jellyroll fold domain-containing protein [Hymenobacter pini]|uniref:LamG-like jellyroll fold domain-containing protein n=1 Tax=Hymenobacter pini TaxID=2880879 RepID=UPI001CF38EE4|nr:LamG-like jellyroll fold domain-containing protein [Hymenobacter pini]MCA8829181.1 Ig-like domain-containing protein [Hymenobacter pini]
MKHPYSSVQRRPLVSPGTHLLLPRPPVGGYLGQFLALLLVLLVSVSSLAQTKVYYSVSDGSFNTTNDQLRSIPLAGGSETVVAPNAGGNNIAPSPSQVAYDATNDRVFIANAVGNSPVIYVVSATGISTVFKTLANIPGATTTILNGMVVDNAGRYLYYALSDNAFGGRLDQLRRIPLGGGDEEVFVNSGTTNFPATPQALALDLQNNRLLVANGVSVGVNSGETNNLYISAVNLTTRAVTKPFEFSATTSGGSVTTQGGIAVNTRDNTLYYVLRDNGITTFNDQLRRIPLGGGIEETVVDVNSNGRGFPTSPGPLSYDAANNRVILGDISINNRDIVAVTPAGVITSLLNDGAQIGTSNTSILGLAVGAGSAAAPTVTTADAASITASSAVLGGTITAENGSITGRGVVYSTTDNTPAIGEAGVTQDANAATTTTFSETISGLAPNTTYYVRAYAINATGTGYGSTFTFVTLANAPTVTTATPSSVTTNSAVLGGNVSADGGATVTGRGVVYSITSTNGTPAIGGTGVTTAANGSGTGTFSATISPLSPGTSYSVRAYATNSAGTSYGAVQTFTTAANAPTVTTATPSSITTNSAVLGGNVTADGGATVTSRGVVYSVTSTNSTPAIGGSGVSTGATGSGSGGFLATTSGLTPNTNYSVRAYATNSAGTSYGAVQTFTTAALPTVVSVTRLDLSPTATTQVSYRVVFSSSVTGVNQSNFTLTNNGLTGTSITGVTGSGTTYTVTANTGSGDGTLRLDVNNTAGNITPAPSNVPYTAGQEYTITKSFAAAPTLRIQAAGSASNNGDVTAFVDVVQVLNASNGSAVTTGLQNGSFEDNNVPTTAGSYLYANQGLTAPPWAFTARSGVSRNGGGISTFNSTAYDGTSVALIQSAGDNNASISQNLAVPTGSYQISFRAIQRNYSSLDQRLNVFVNDVFLGTFQPNNVPSYGLFTSPTFSVTAPALTATITSAAGNNGGSTSISPIPFTVTFSQNVTGFEASDVTVGNGTLSGFAAVDGKTYTFNVTPTVNGNVTVNVPADVAADANNTANSAAPQFTIQYAQTVTAAPVVTAPANGSLTNNPRPTYSGTAAAGSTVTIYAGPASGSATAIGTVTATGGTFSLPQPTALAGGTYQVYATAQLNGQAVSANSNTNTFTVDTQAPSVASIVRLNPSTATTNATSLTFRVTFSEAVTGVTTGSFTFTTTGGSTTGSIASGAAVSGSNNTQYDVTVNSVSGNGTVRLDVKSSGSGITDGAGNALNGGYTSGQSYTVIQSVTVTSVTRLTPSPTATSQVTYQVVFSGSVTGLTTNNFTPTITGGSVSGASVSSVSGSGTTYTVVVNTGTGSGTLRLDVTSSTGTTPTISNVPYTTGEQYTITKSFAAAPTLRIQAGGSPTGNPDVTAFVDVVQVLNASNGSAVTNGLQNGSFETNNVDPSSFKKTPDVLATPWAFTGFAGISRNGSQFSSSAYDGTSVALIQSAGDDNASISQNLAVPTGSYQISFQAIQRNYTGKNQRLNVFVNDVFVGSIQPNNGNPPTYDTFTSAAFSVTAPALTATVSTSSTSPTSTSPIPFSVSFSQSVGTSFTASDVTVAGGTLTSGSFSGSGAGPYTFTVTPSGAGNVSVSLAADVAQDANNTGNMASNTVSVQFQIRTAAPVVTTPANNSSVSTNQPTYTGTAPASSTITVYVDNTNIGTTTANASGNWTLTQPTALASGSHTVYATAQASGEAVSSPSTTNNFTVLNSATYTSSTTEQLNTGLAQVGSTNQEILRVSVVIGGGTSAPLSATSLTFTTTGSTRPADIAAARVYYTGTNGTLTTTTLFGSAVASPNGTFTVTGNQLLTTGTNYFFLVYDVAATATPGGVLDATLTSLTVGGTVRTPTVTDPTGNRRIVQTSRVAGMALRFVGGGTPGYVDFSASTTAAPVLGPSYTQVAWIKPAIGTSSDTYYILGNGTGNTAAPYIAITGNGRVEAGFGTGSTLRSIRTGPQTVTANEWSQIAATFNGSALTVYLNGDVIALVNGTGSPVATPVNYVGNAGTTGTSFYPGNMDEVSQWNRALSQTEIRQLRHLTLSGGENGLVSYLQFNENGATTTLDGVSGAVGTLTGASRVTSTAPVGAGTSNLQSVSATGNYTFTGTNVAINFTSAGSTPYDVVVTRLEGTPLGTPVTDPNLRSTHTRAYWIVDRYSTSTFSASITYTLDQGLISAGDAAAPANLKLYKRGSNSDGAFDAPISATAANAVASTVTFPVNSFSQTFIGTYGSSPLPVELVRFTAERKGNDALLLWATAQERNNAYFEVESSVDGRTFRAVGRVTGQGSSNQGRAYSLTDQNLGRYGRALIYYRLRQVDTDGTTAYSGVQTVQIPRVATDLTVSVFPNPTAGQLTIRLSDAYTGKAQGGLFDAQGRLVQELSHQLATATSLDIPVSVQHLPTGVYTLRLILNGQVLHQQVVVQH